MSDTTPNIGDLDTVPEAGAPEVTGCTRCAHADMDEGTFCCGALFSAQLEGRSERAEAIKGWMKATCEAGLWPKAAKGQLPLPEATGCPAHRASPLARLVSLMTSVADACPDLIKQGIAEQLAHPVSPDHLDLQEVIGDHALVTNGQWSLPLGKPRGLIDAAPKLARRLLAEQEELARTRAALESTKLDRKRADFRAARAETALADARQQVMDLQRLIDDVAAAGATPPPSPALPGGLSDENLLQIEGRYGQATGGTWTVEPHGPPDADGRQPLALYAGRTDERHGLRLLNLCDGDQFFEGNAAFIAAAHQDVPALLAEVRRLRQCLSAGAGHPMLVLDTDTVPSERLEQAISELTRLPSNAPIVVLPEGYGAPPSQPPEPEGWVFGPDLRRALDGKAAVGSDPLVLEVQEALTSLEARRAQTQASNDTAFTRLAEAERTVQTLTSQLSAERESHQEAQARLTAARLQGEPEFSVAHRLERTTGRGRPWVVQGPGFAQKVGELCFMLTMPGSAGISPEAQLLVSGGNEQDVKFFAEAAQDCHLLLRRVQQLTAESSAAQATLAQQSAELAHARQALQRQVETKTALEELEQLAEPVEGDGAVDPMRVLHLAATPHDEDEGVLEELAEAAPRLARALIAQRGTGHDGAGRCTCGMPMSRNPHPDAGKPTALLAVGASYVCIPCTVRGRHGWCEQASAAERERDRAQAHYDEAAQETSRLRSGVTEALKMPWDAHPQGTGAMGYSCPDDIKIIAAVLRMRLALEDAPAPTPERVARLEALEQAEVEAAKLSLHWRPNLAVMLGLAQPTDLPAVLKAIDTLQKLLAAEQRRTSSLALNILQIEDEATRQREVTQSLMAVIVHAGGVARRLTGLSERP